MEYLIIFLVCCLIFVASNEIMLDQVYLKNRYEEITLPGYMQQTLNGLSYSSLFFAILSIWKAYMLAQDTLYLVFPEHLIRLYTGLREQGLK